MSQPNNWIGNVPDNASSSTMNVRRGQGEETSMVRGLAGVLPGYGLPVSSTFPLPARSGPGSQPFLGTSMGSLSGTGAASRARATRFFGASSGHHPMVTPSYRMRLYDDGRHTMCYEGHIMMALRGGRTDEDMVTLLNHRQVNAHIRKMYKRAREMLAEALSKPGEGIGTVTHEQLQTLNRLPTSSWVTYQPFVDCLNSDNSAMRALTYLCPAVVFRQWNVAGMMLGQLQVSSTYGYANTTLLTKGETEDLVNIWGPNLHAGDELCLVFTQLSEYVHDVNGTKYRVPGPPMWVPWSGRHRPSIRDLPYTDITGHTCYGIVLKVATFLCFDATARSTPNKPYAVEAGVVDPPEGYLFNNPLDALITVTWEPRVGLHTPVYS